MTIQAENETLENETIEQPEQPEVDIVEQEVLHPDQQRLADAIKADQEEQARQAAADEEAKKADEAAKAAEAKAAPAKGEEGKAEKPQVPVDALVAVRKKGQEAEQRVTERDARLAILAELADTLTPEQIRAIAAGKQTVEQAQAENAAEEDPHDLLDAKALDLEKQRQDGDIDAVEYRKGMLAIEKERRTLMNKAVADTNAQQRNQDVREAVKEPSKKLEAEFDVFDRDAQGRTKITTEQLEDCKPAAARATLAGMEAEFGKGAVYSDLNPKHRLFFQYNLGIVANRVYGDGKGPRSQQTKDGKPQASDGKPNVKEVIAKSPAVKAAAAAAPALARDKTPPDLSQFTFSADTELGQAERALASGDSEAWRAIAKAKPELIKQLEGRT